MSLEKELKKHFGYDEFRGCQKEIIQHVLAHKNTFVLMPTGAGKSLCYQLPAAIMEGTAIIISPLIALMKNQVDQLRSYGIACEYLNSTLTKTEATRVKKDTVAGKVKMLYVAPETLTKEENVVFLKKINISFVAVDEVHCISEWGHDFRPEYRKIRVIVNNIREHIPIIALTATATPKVQQDIVKNLGLEDFKTFKTSFRRPNLDYEVRPKLNAKKSIIQFLAKRKGQSGIIYCLSRRRVTELAEFLQLNGHQALPYHAGLDSAVRIQNQDAFLHEEADIIVATIAFGMGIDKPNVRFVVHYDAPKSLEGYYQETGRAGRDGKSSSCLLYYSYNDVLKLEKFNKDKSVKEKETNKILLEEVIGYAESSTCRPRQLLHYFGETSYENCGICDNCKNPKESYDASEILPAILHAVKDSSERFGLNHIADILKGKHSDYVDSYHHDQLAAFGFLKKYDMQEVKGMIRQALIKNFLFKDIETVGVLKLSELGEAYLQQPQKVEFSKDHHYEKLSEAQEEEVQEDEGLVLDKALFALLKTLRKQVASQKELPPYVVFQDESLEEMCTHYPTSIDELSHIHGVGIGKAKKFGKDFIAAIKKYVEENSITPPTEVYVKTSVNKSKNKILIIQQVDKKIDLDDIASSLKLSLEDVIEEMQHICHSGTKLDIDYYLEEVVDEDKIDEIYDYFLEAESDDIDEAMEELGDDFSEDEIKLVHIKFISEVAI